MKSSHTSPVKSLFRRSAVSHAIGAVTGALFCLPVWAQTATAGTDTSGDTTQKVVVTGSMIARTNAETAEAITTISADSLKAMGITTVEQALAQVSANQSGQVTASAVGSFDGGASLAALRGLDAGKTLVLLDGQRLANNVYSGDAVDLNLIPFAAIDRIEVLREGASSIYGADAIAGVINFITKKDYKGGEIDLSGSRSQGHGANNHAVSLTFGKGSLTTDGYNVMAAANFSDTEELRGFERSYTSGYNPGIGLAISNSPGTWPGSYTDSNGNQFQVNAAGCPGNPYPTNYLGKCDYLYADAVDLIPASTQSSGLFSISKALPGDNTVTAQYYIAKSKVTAWGGPMFYQFNMSPTEDATYFPTAANSTSVGGTATPNLANDITASWTDPANNRYNTYDNTEQRILLTLTGERSGWSYATNASYSTNQNIQSGIGYPNEANFLTSDGYLSPLINPFGDQSAAGQALINNSYDNGDWAIGKLSTWDVNGQVSHDLPDFFHAGSPASVAVGMDVRGEHIAYNTTPLAATLTAGVTGFPPTSVVGSRNEQAVFTEVQLPVTKQLDLTVSDREDRYSDFGHTNNGKVAFRYQPSSLVTFRGAASTGFRAPTLVNLFSPQTLGAVAGDMDGPGCPAGNDPTYGTIFNSTTCNSQGLVLSGGNPHLKPELSQNFDLGIVLAPVKDWGVTVDWYRIVVSHDISSVPTSTVYANPGLFLNTLYKLNNAGTLTPSIAQAQDCPTPQAATCGYILSNLANVGGRQTNGFDFSSSYLLRTSTGMYRFGLDGTLVTQFRRQSYTGAPWVSVLGKYNGTNQVVVPWQSTVSVDWSKDIWAAGLSEHFDSQYQDQQDLSNGDTRMVKPYSIYNLYGSVKPMSNVTVLLGVHNLFNRNPPATNQYVSNFQLGYNPLLADPTGRALYATAKIEF